MEIANPAEVAPRPENQVETFVRRWQGGDIYCVPQPPGILTTVPYPGLRSFRVDMNRFFCGRENQKQDLKKFFADRGGRESDKPRRMTVVVGGSGSGKSSLTRAGLIAELNSIPIKGQWGAWYVVDTRPGTDPIKQLLDSLWLSLRRFVDLAFAGTSTASDRKGDFPERKPEEKAASVEQASERIGAVAGALGIEWADNKKAAEEGVRRWLTRKISPRLGTISASALFDFVDGALKAFDGAASFGAERNVSPLLFLHVDQFEEVFRDECDARGREALIKLVRDIHDYRPERLFAVATMRSEEIHRFSEYAGMSQVINSSMYLVDLVAGEEIESVIVDPAQRLARLWQLPLDSASGRSFAPYTQETVRLLQKAYWQAGDAAVHTADRLPLLQHALPLVWGRAVEEWIPRRASDPRAPFEIGKRHLETVPGWVEEQGVDNRSQLQRCLNADADDVFTKARDEFASGSSPNQTISPKDLAAEAKGILKVAFSSLAQLDDNGKPVRRFITVNNMLEASGGAERLGKTDDALDELRFRLTRALGRFETAGMVEVLPSQMPDSLPKYNVTHEAFIRNWSSYLGWLDEKKNIETGLRNTARSVSDLGPQDWSRSTWRNFGLAAKASSAIPAVSASALDEIFADDAPYSQSWAEAVLGSNASDISGIKQARLWANWWKDRGKRLKDTATVLTRIAAAAVMVVLAALLFTQIEKSRYTLLSLQVNEASSVDRTAVYDRMYDYVIGKAYGEYNSALFFSDILSQTIGSIDEGARKIYGRDMNIRFPDEFGEKVGTFDRKDEPARCDQVPNSSAGSEQRNGFRDTLGKGWLCQSKNREWQLRLSTDANTVQIWRRNQRTNEMFSQRVALSAENLARLEQMQKKTGLLVRVAGQDKPCAYFFSSEGVVGFWVTTISTGECKDDDVYRKTASSQDVIMWTTTGFSDPDEIGPGVKVDWDSGDECVYRDVPARDRENLTLQRCITGAVLLDADKKRIFIFRDPMRCSSELESDKLGNPCENNIEIQYDGQNEDEPNPLVRAKILDFGPQILSAKIADGWLWLKYNVNGESKVKRYLVGMEPMRRMLRSRWLGMKWKRQSCEDSADESGTDIRIPKSCSGDPQCQAYIDQQDTEGDWPARPKPDEGKPKGLKKCAEKPH
ncbi:hypothetical protein FJV76_26030 [Mesorhizobium sp. WSM4303]|uniref:nSTAND1 domain-containing NTPase n=1 Tax=unclassified Mesorhizobium TaxID=325217 RepID=UPI00115E8870|nr:MULTISPECIES: hypothetical protein [unclassified Mesorhizobium]TRC96097.1 hypothetical protein FJV77_14475 [Mesorhizobium sp. WSM4306]TRC98193.1 hypothetical protein FJV76_26030 [Mesorhizobium sp. WSM4303]